MAILEASFIMVIANFSGVVRGRLEKKE